jgi:hypothetical protein
MVDTPTGPEPQSEVNDEATEDFSSHFAEFASGNPDPNPGDSDDGNDDDTAGGDEGEEPGEASPPADAPGDEPAAGDPIPDPWANASPELIAARDAMRADYDRRVAGASGRASGLQRQLNELQAKAGKSPPPQEAAEGEKAPEDMSEEEWKAFTEDYPEIAKFIAPMRHKLSNVERTVVPISAARAEEAVKQAFAVLEQEHADFRQFGDPTIPGYAAELEKMPPEAQQLNATFHGWLGAQRPGIQALYSSDDAADAATVLRMFKTERAAAMKQPGEGAEPKPTDTTGAKRARQLEGGRHVGSKPGSAAAGAPDDFEGAFAHFSAKQQRRK